MKSHLNLTNQNYVSNYAATKRNNVPVSTFKPPTSKTNNTNNTSKTSNLPKTTNEDAKKVLLMTDFSNNDQFKKNNKNPNVSKHISSQRTPHSNSNKPEFNSKNPDIKGLPYKKSSKSSEKPSKHSSIKQDNNEESKSKPKKQVSLKLSDSESDNDNKLDKQRNSTKLSVGNNKYSGPKKQKKDKQNNSDSDSNNDSDSDKKIVSRSLTDEERFKVDIDNASKNKEVMDSKKLSSKHSSFKLNLNKTNASDFKQNNTKNNFNASSNKTTPSIQNINNSPLSKINFDNLPESDTTNDQNNNTYITVDYIVIGIGRAGSIVMNKLLSKSNDNVKILGIEWGSKIKKEDLAKNKETTNTIIIPSKVNSENNTFFGIKTPIMAGGNSNFKNLHVWGTKTSLDSWIENTGMESKNWTSQKIFNRMKKLENYINNGNSNSNQRGTNGIISVSNDNLSPSKPNSNSTMDILTRSVLDKLFAKDESKEVTDYNKIDSEICISRFSQFQQKNIGKKSIASNTFDVCLPLNSVIDEDGNGVGTHKNIKILFNSKVKRILFSKTKDADPQATGVEVNINGKLRTIMVTKKIILTAGIHSSPILQLSGIGDSAYLASLGIKSIYDNPNVGNNLSTQTDVRFVATCDNEEDKEEHEDSVNEAGPIFFYHIPNKDEIESDNSDLKTHIRTAQAIVTSDISKVINIGTSSPNDFGIININLDTKSRGMIRIHSNDYTREPEIIAGFYENQEDLEFSRLSLRTLKFIIDDMNTLHPKRNYRIKYPESVDFDNDDDIDNYIKQHETLFFQNNWMGSNKMGSLKNKGVVDSLLHVHGVNGLMIANSSIIPISYPGNKAMITNVIAEMGAEIALITN